MTTDYRAALDEIAAVTDGIDDASVDTVCKMIAEAERIVLAGCGRELLHVRGFAMRLFHLGLDVAVAGDLNTPPVGPGDVFIASSGPGELRTMNALLNVALDAGAAQVVITAEPDSTAAALADHVLLVPAQTMASDQGERARSVLPMGSVFEGALFILFEVMVERLKAMTGATPEAMRARHTNLE